MSKKILQGVVVSAKTPKTAIVRVERIMRHPKYLKRMTISDRYKAHYEDITITEGDTVRI